MKGTNMKLCLILFMISFAAVLPTLNGHIAEFDEWWQKRADEALNNTLKTYHPTPENVISHTNEQVHRALQEISYLASGSKNSTRRILKGHKYGGPCVATNPIDRCWRCQRNWARNRKRLADCGLGFGKQAIGGKMGNFYVVTDSSDNDMVNPKPGTLRHAVIQKEPLWIIFAKSMIIRLNQELIMQGDKTIDGRGVNVHIAHGAGIMMQFVNNIIIHGLHIHDISSGNGGIIRDAVDHYGLRQASDGDGLSIFGSTNIWIDHVSMRNCKDGLIDAIEGSTGITVSNNHFTDHNDVMLLGASNIQTKDKMLQVTVAFNHFGKRLIQRMPRVRYGLVHVVNNDYTHWNMYAIGGSQNPTIISQGNRFIAPPNDRLKEVTKREQSLEPEWKNWNWRSEGDLMMNGAYFRESGDPNAIKKYAAKYSLVPAAPGTQVTTITRFAGSLNCFAGRPC